jgi:dihydropteroate synthase
MQTEFPAAHANIARARVMGILNVTPDSFSDGGRYLDAGKAVEHALQLVAEGADIIDVGGESTRPGADSVSLSEEIDRVVPVIEGIGRASTVTISIDTSKPEVMRAAATAGATLINDVRALGSAGAMEVVADLGLPVCLMHMQGQPANMQQKPTYADVVEDVRAFLLGRAEACVKSGISHDRILLDPGFGFGKSLQHNLDLLRHLDRIVDTGFPVLAGLSRKSMIGTLLGDQVADRAAGSVTLALYAVRKGVHIVRVHDVAQTVDALKVEAAVDNC